MPKDEQHLEELLHMLEGAIPGTTTALRLTSYLRTLRPEAPIGTRLTQHGQDWFLSLNLSDLYQEQSGTETGKTRPTSNSPDGSR